MIPPTQSQAARSLFGDKHSLALRIWHWTSSTTIIVLLITVFVSDTFLKPRTNARMIREKLDEKGVQISQDQARSVAKALENEIWTWHKYIGVGLAILLLLRIIAEFFEPSGQSLRSRIRKGALYLKQPGNNSREGKHYLYVKYLYVFFYFVLTGIVITGIGIIYSDDISALKASKETLKDIHSIFMKVIIGFIILHIGGILRSEVKDRPGLVSDMIHGGKGEIDSSDSNFSAK